MLCKECGLELEERTNFCPQCGNQIGKVEAKDKENMEAPKKKRKILLLIPVLVIVGVVFIITSKWWKIVSQGEAYLDAGDAEEALDLNTLGEDSEEKGDGQIAELLQFAKQAVEAEKYDIAYEYYEKVESDVKDNQEVYLGMAAIHLRKNEPLEAVRILNRGMQFCQNTEALQEKREYVIENTIVLKVSEYRADKSLYQEYYYDEMGNELSEFWYESDGSLYHGNESTYDEKGNELTYKYYSSDGSISEYKYKYIYDERGNMISELEYSDGNEYRYDSTYDNNGNKLTVVNYKNGIAVSVKRMTYDENGNCLAEQLYRNGEIVYSYNYSYDQNDNMLSEIYDARYDGRSHSRFYTYDESGNQLTEMYKYYDEKGVLYAESTIKRDYDEEGNCLKETWCDPNGDMKMQYQRTYDAHGNELTEVRYLADGTIDSIMESIYDEMDNLVTEVWYHEKGDLSSWYDYVYTLKYVGTY